MIVTPHIDYCSTILYLVNEGYINKLEIIETDLWEVSKTRQIYNGRSNARGAELDVLIFIYNKYNSKWQNVQAFYGWKMRKHGANQMRFKHLHTIDFAKSEWVVFMRHFWTHQLGWVTISWLLCFLPYTYIFSSLRKTSGSRVNNACYKMQNLFKSSASFLNLLCWKHICF